MHGQGKFKKSVFTLKSKFAPMVHEAKMDSDEIRNSSSDMSEKRAEEAETKTSLINQIKNVN